MMLIFAYLYVKSVKNVALKCFVMFLLENLQPCDLLEYKVKSVRPSRLCYGVSLKPWYSYDTNVAISQCNKLGIP